ncbi:hypothetical protein COV56_00020 [Candidatus Kuenenbacteria bacterium CG11_big_fil_rev_8_21_14_0_20_37_9]|uniref:Uncharacterized protein n=2 Tax=Candidatus Kueneniibacteriota TaxID=1752740 RepID=A0A2M6XT17_9BACT|nr:MAG: hypothetical protein AUJ29_02800 [Candidatus Kuenenbacteria bacterium CG1_02_38_13]PIR05942.1 MAG: hypothetical protein COV56_00020 [Candidatus Kuenenbacteria bacterium CG11_big_fil_rev_8_21_14_0_20_37_9]PIU10782.1 MAG: hypothetical protein COT27_01285 [Candidatus Kuenenbacteria bacterium CG08_land_8_20_14_0_20_37_23]
MPINPDKLKNQPILEQSSIQAMLEEQKEILDEIYKETRKTRHYIMVGKIISFIYLLLIIVPIIFAIIYLPSLIKNAIAPYQDLLNNGQGAKGNFDMNSINDILKQLGK